MKPLWKLNANAKPRGSPAVYILRRIGDGELVAAGAGAALLEEYTVGKEKVM